MFYEGYSTKFSQMIFEWELETFPIFSGEVLVRSCAVIKSLPIVLKFPTSQHCTMQFTL